MAQNPSNVIPDQLIVVEGGKQLVPAPSSGDSGKVLGVLNSDGDIGWTEDREGMAQQQADWAETDPSKVTFIAHKPSGQMAPASTSSDAGKVLKVDAQGAPVWGDVSGVAEFLWSTVTRADVDAAMADGKMPVILDDTFSGAKTYCYLSYTSESTPADTLNFYSIPYPGTFHVLYHAQSATIWKLSFNPGGVKSRSSRTVAAEITADSSITLVDANSKLKITVTNPLPVSAQADAGKVLTVDSNGAAGWQTPATVTVDQTYNASSANAQSGTAVAGAVSRIRQVPSSTSADADKVLTVNSSGTPEWATAQGGGADVHKILIPDIKPSDVGTRAIVFKVYGYLQENWEDPSQMTYTPDPHFPAQGYSWSDHPYTELDVIDAANGIYRIRWTAGAGNDWNRNNSPENFYDLKSIQDNCGGTMVAKILAVDFTDVTDIGKFFYGCGGFFGDLNFSGTESVQTGIGFMSEFGTKVNNASSDVPYTDTFYSFPMDLSSCTSLSGMFTDFGKWGDMGDYTAMLKYKNLPELTVGSALTDVRSAFSSGWSSQGNVYATSAFFSAEDNILETYSKLSALPNISNTDYCFGYCGAGTESGVAALAQIPTSWGGNQA